MATVTFRNTEQAKLAVNKFTGAPIDGGRSRLRLSLIVDPTKTTQDLAQRITPVNRGSAAAAAPPRRRNRVAQAKATNRKALPSATKTQKVKREKPVQERLEDLDKEMADYFEEKKD